MIAYKDLDFPIYINNRKSTLGYVFMMEGGAISIKCVMQTLIASSTMHAEIVACYKPSNQAI